MIVNRTIHVKNDYIELMQFSNTFKVAMLNVRHIYISFSVVKPVSTHAFVYFILYHNLSLLLI